MYNVKKIFAIFLSMVVLVINLIPVIPVQAVEEKGDLAYQSDGTFKIMQIPDIQEAYPYADKMQQDIRNYLAYEKPNLVVLTGDNLAGEATPEQTKEMLEAMFAPFDEMKVPWIMTFGNHDWEVGLSEVEMIEYVKANSTSFIGDLGDIEIQGAHPLDTRYQDGRYGQGAYEITGTDNKTKNIVYLLDSGTYREGGKPYGYGSITPAQVDWYNTKSQEYKQQNDGNPVSSLMFFHIPTAQWNDAFDSGTAQGYRLEDAYIQSDESGIVEKAVENGDVKGMFVGHDHVNDYVGEYKDIKLAYGGAANYDSYNNDVTRGVRVIVLDEKQPDVVNTYMRRQTEVSRNSSNAATPVNNVLSEVVVPQVNSNESVDSTKLTHYLQFEGDTKNMITDTMLASGNIEYVDGINGQGIKYSEKGYVSLGAIDYPQDKDFTLSLWTKREAGGDAPFLSNKDWNSGSNPGFALAIHNGMYPWLNFRDANKEKSRLDYKLNDGIIADNSWHHVSFAIDRQAKTVTTYVDGKKIHSGDISQFEGLSFDSGLETILGNDGNKDQYSPYYVGIIDEVRFFERALQEGEVATLSQEFEAPIETTFQSISFPQRYMTVLQKDKTVLAPVVSPVTADDQLVWKIIGGNENGVIDEVTVDSLQATLSYSKPQSLVVKAHSKNREATEATVRIAIIDQPETLTLNTPKTYYVIDEKIQVNAATDIDGTSFSTVTWEVNNDLFSQNITKINHNDLQTVFSERGAYEVKATAQEGGITATHTVKVIEKLDNLIRGYADFLQVKPQISSKALEEKQVDITEVEAIISTYNENNGNTKQYATEQYALELLTKERIIILENTLAELVATAGQTTTQVEETTTVGSEKLASTGQNIEILLATATVFILTGVVIIRRKK